MKLKAICIVGAVMLSACSSMKSVETRKTYAQPNWYQNCVQSGKEGWFWAEKEFAYSCGAGESRYAQAAEEQMYAIAMNNFAKRINGRVNSSTDIKFVDEKKSTKTVISYHVPTTRINQHLMKESGTFVMDGKYYTFIRLKMPKEVFDSLVKESAGS